MDDARARRHDPDHRVTAILARLPGGTPLRRWLAAVAITIAVFTGAYVVLLGWSVADGLYMTVITVTTIGFREVRELDMTGRAITMLAAFAGVALIFGGVGIMAETLAADLASGRRERRRMTERIAARSGHILVCGYGRVGSTVAHELRRAGRAVVVLDRDPASLDRARTDGFDVVAGDVTEDATLDAAGIVRAAGLVASVDSDAQNVYVVLSARTRNPALTIVARAAGPSAEAKLRQAGADRIVSPYTMAGRRIAELATRPAVVDYIDAALSSGGASFAIEQRRVGPGDPLAGRRIGELAAGGVLTLAVVTDGTLVPHPPAERTIAAGDELIVSGATENLHAVLGNR